MARVTPGAAAAAAVIAGHLRAAGISEAVAAKHAGMSPAALRRSLTGRRALLVTELAALADLLGTSPSGILREAEDRTTTTASGCIVVLLGDGHTIETDSGTPWSEVAAVLPRVGLDPAAYIGTDTDPARPGILQHRFTAAHPNA